eukprot:TRINITY_DN21712_c0_g1_i1.p1 TRINITY_DN21712_c0_g1~~TRINITY_DN21712_c0_g1_i1.p1  ORF type:complete len:535 (-),score=132.91 TRINITY_DN21712_c0_g1_i1:45-1547(-)
MENGHGNVEERRRVQKERYRKAGQEHVFQFEESLSEAQKEILYKELESIPVERIESYYKNACDFKSSQEKLTLDDIKSTEASLTPLADKDLISLARQQSDPNLIPQYFNRGIELISQGKAAALVLGGGQGTRLSATDPKGMYDILLPSHKSLFQIQAEKLIALQNLIQKRLNLSNPLQIPWYIMTSKPTDKPTREFFSSNNYFGLSASQVTFFEQEVLPCLTNTGKIIMESGHNVALTPNGNGGLYTSMYRNNILSDMKSKGIEYVYQYCVDNILIRMLDPVFIGFMNITNSDVALKILSKTAPDERVGVLCMKDGIPTIIEYSEVTDNVRNQRNVDGKLRFAAGHICMNGFSRAFIENLIDSSTGQLKEAIPYHIAVKDIKAAGEAGEDKGRIAKGAWKLEQFVFDVFPKSERIRAWEVEREDEFSPLKNNDGAASDNPRTCRDSVYRLHTKWVERAGGKVEAGTQIEVSPLASYDGEGLERVKGQTFSGVAHIKGDKE